MDMASLKGCFITSEELMKLKAPFGIDKLSWRVGQKSNWDRVKNCPKDPEKPVKAMMLVYVDSRDVQDRLDEVFGANWNSEFREVNNRIVCRITIRGISKEDGAGDTDFEGEKGGLSDAFKRAAVQWGVGRYLYEAKNYNTWVDCTDMKDYEIYTKNKEQLDTVAALIGKNYTLYHMYLDVLDQAKTIEDLERIKEEARFYAKREQWSQGNLATFKGKCEEIKKSLEVAKKAEKLAEVYNEKISL